MPDMRLTAVAASWLAFLATTPASAQVTQVQLAYDTYAAGIEVMQMQAFFGLGPWNYHISIDYHTTGLVGLFYRGRQTNSVHGIWHDDLAQPQEFSGEGVWRGQNRRTLIAYDHGVPEVKELQPPQETEREPVPPEFQRDTMDTLSALAQLMRRVQSDHTCDTEVHTYDGRRVLDIVAHTGGPEPLAPTSRSTFSGATLRCDFEGRELAGFLLGAGRRAAPQPAARIRLAGARPPRRPSPAGADRLPDALVRLGDHVSDWCRPLGSLRRGGSPAKLA